MKFKIEPNIKDFKIEPGIIISKLDLKDGDTIIITVDINEWDVENASKMCEIVSKKFPNNNVVLMTKGIKIKAVPGRGQTKLSPPAL